MKLKVAIVGAGQQSTKDHVPTIQNSPDSEVVCICDTDPERAHQLATQLHVPGYTSLSQMMDEQQFDTAVVAVPHSHYLTSLQPLMAQGIHVLKEKPLACSLAEARQFESWSRMYGVKLMVSTQRRFDPAFRIARSLIPELGPIYEVHGQYLKNISRLDVGWRANFSTSRGGALLDMGYHFVDLILWFLGTPQAGIARIGTGNRKGQHYDVEDTIQMSLTYGTTTDRNGSYLAQATISRAAPFSSEELTIIGTNGALLFQNDKIKLLETNGSVRLEIAKSKDWQLALQNQWNAFCALVRGNSIESTNLASEHLGHLALIDGLYSSAYGYKTDLVTLENLDKQEDLYYAA